MRQTALNSSSNCFCCYICTFHCDHKEEEDKSDSKQLPKSNSKLDILISRPCRDVLDKQKAQNQGGYCWVLICGLGFLYTQGREYIIILYTLTYIQIIMQGSHLDRFVTRHKFKDNFGCFGRSRTCVEQWDVHAHACMDMEASMGCPQVFRTDLIK